jgi:hypothetical protein
MKTSLPNHFCSKSYTVLVLRYVLIIIYRYHFVDTMERVRTAKEEQHYHLHDLRFSRRFVLVRVAYLSSSEAYTYNSDVCGKENYLAFDWWKHFM